MGILKGSKAKKIARGVELAGERFSDLMDFLLETTQDYKGHRVFVGEIILFPEYFDKSWDLTELRFPVEIRMNDRCVNGARAIGAMGGNIYSFIDPRLAAIDLNNGYLEKSMVTQRQIIADKPNRISYEMVQFTVPHIVGHAWEHRLHSTQKEYLPRGPKHNLEFLGRSLDATVYEGKIAPHITTRIHTWRSDLPSRAGAFKLEKLITFG